MKKRILSLVLAAAMLIGMFPAGCAGSVAAGPEQGIRRGSAFAVFVGGDDIGAEPSALALPSLLLPRRSAFFCTLRPHRGA